jgi:cyanophycinase
MRAGFIVIGFLWPVVTSCQGSLFIIGGGDRTPAMMQFMLAGANLKPSDYILVMTMSSAEPDSSFIYFSADILPHTQRRIVHFNYPIIQSQPGPWLDTIRRAKLIFITGGVQTRFMNAIAGTSIAAAMHDAYHSGAMIAGTSAGAAVMSADMITGQKIGPRPDDPFWAIQTKTVEIKPGLGFLKNTIIDQHFIARSRYNRMLSILTDRNDLIGVGIDESTAIWITKRKTQVVGEGQVLVFTKLRRKTIQGQYSFRSVRIQAYRTGDRFRIKK